MSRRTASILPGCARSASSCASLPTAGRPSSSRVISCRRWRRCVIASALWPAGSSSRRGRRARFEGRPTGSGSRWTTSPPPRVCSSDWVGRPWRPPPQPPDPESWWSRSRTDSGRPTSTPRSSVRGSASTRSNRSGTRWKTSSCISWRASMFRVVLSKQVRRWRTWLLAAALAGIPVLVVVAVRLSPPPPQNSQDAPPFLLQIVRNGLFAPLTGLALVQPFFMSVAIGLFAGDAIAGEAQTGTLRYLLVRPVRRTRLIMSKYAAAMAFTGALLLIVIASGLLAGGVLFGIHPMPTLSGTSLSVLDGLARILASGLFILLAASGIVAVGMWISTLTDSGPGAIVATVIVAIASQIADQIPSLHAIQPFLPTHGWLGYTGLFRFPIDLATMREGLTISAVYTVVFLALAVWRFRTRDISA